MQYLHFAGFEGVSVDSFEEHSGLTILQSLIVLREVLEIVSYSEIALSKGFVRESPSRVLLLQIMLYHTDYLRLDRHSPLLQSLEHILVPDRNVEEKKRILLSLYGY